MIMMRTRTLLSYDRTTYYRYVVRYFGTTCSVYQNANTLADYEERGTSTSNNLHN